MFNRSLNYATTFVFSFKLSRCFCILLLHHSSRANLGASPFKVYLNKTLPMIENLSHYWDKADGKTKKKILGCIFTEKFENFDFESCNNIFTPEIKSIMLASKVLRRNKNKKEVKNDLLSNMAPPVIQSCSMNKTKCIFYSLRCNKGQEDLSIKKMI